MLVFTMVYFLGKTPGVLNTQLTVEIINNFSLQGPICTFVARYQYRTKGKMERKYNTRSPGQAHFFKNGNVILKKLLSINCKQFFVAKSGKKHKAKQKPKSTKHGSV